MWKRIICSAGIVVGLFTLVCLPGSLVEDCSAAGAINYKVKISNPTDGTVRVQVAIEDGNVFSDTWKSTDMVTIRKGGSHTFETGAWCPAGVMGEYYDADSRAWREMKSKSCLGHDVSSEGFSACCWSPINFKICRKAGEGYSDIRDKDFGFCKD